MKDHWQIYKSLASDLRKRAKWEHVEEPRQKRFLEMAEFVETQPKFYVPDMYYAGGKESQEVGTRNDNLIRLPYPKVVVLMDEILRSANFSEAQHADHRAKDLKRYIWEDDYAKRTMEAQDKFSHRPTVVLAEQFEGNDDIEVMIGSWNALNKEWNPFAAKALLTPDEVGYKIGLASNDFSTNLHLIRVQAMMKDQSAATAWGVVRDQFKGVTLSLTFLHMLLSLENVEIKKRGAPKLSVVGSRNQKKKHKAHKSFDYHVLSINGETWDSPYEDVGGGHGGVRSHLRRGHIRRLSDGKTTWVRAAFIKGSKEGFVNKDYDVLGGNYANQETQL
tara:strand:+ start:87 stop:1085 length:999 start_codon:yes stop_codon:yes gene_type:complete